MNYKKKEHFRCKLQRMIIPWMALLLIGVVQNVCAQDGPKKTSTRRASRYSYLPSGYNQVGNTQLYYKQNSNAIDMIGYYNGYYYSSTYSDYGYKLSVQVGSNSATRVDCLNGTTSGGVTVQPSVEQQGELARICYTVTNANEADVVISLGTHADVMIGNNDAAPISRRIDTIEQTYGLTMQDGNGAQLCVLFGSGLAGVTAVSDFWFGGYYTNTEAYNMVGNYNTGSNWMVENGSYDSGMGWCWKNRNIPAGSTVVFSYLIGVGEVNLEPNSTFEVTPDDPEGWNDLSLIHVLTLEGNYESPAGLDGRIEYAVEDSEEWVALTEMLPSGSTFTGTVRALFDATRDKHVIRFRTVDNVGNTTLLAPIEYKDVSFHALSNIEDKTFTGDSLYQTDVTCDLNEEQYILTGYQNNKNVGTASFRVEGVFPYTIGRKTYTFTINPQPLAGQLVLAENSFVYNGQPFTSDWQFSNEAYAALEADTDYTTVWSNNTLPGTGTLTVTGKGNYAGELTANITIDKAPLIASLYTLTLPAEDISYDAQPHAATVETSEGVGIATITYALQGSDSYTADAPVNEGAYDVFLTIDDGTLYYGKERTKVGSFAIYTFSATEWASLKDIYMQLATSNPVWATRWQNIINSNTGMLSVGQLEGVTVEKGHIVGFDFSSKNLNGVFPSMLLTFPAVKVLDLRGNNLSGDIENIIEDVYAYILQYAPTFVSELQTLNITDNKLTGNIGLLAASTTMPSLLTRFPQLTTLWASGNSFTNIYPHLPASIVNLDLTNQVMDLEMNIDLSNFDVDALISQIPTLFVYNHQEQSYNTTPYARLSNYPPTATANDYTVDKPYWGVDVFLLNGNLSLTCLADNTYKGTTGDILYVSYPIATEEVFGSYCYTKYTFSQGDANFVDGVDITDLQATINYIFGSYNTYPFNFNAADTYQDGRLNVQDVVCTANIIMDAEESPAESPVLNVKRAAAQDGNETEAYVFVRGGDVVLYTAIPIASFDMVFEGSPKLNFNLESQGYDVISKQNNATSRFIGYTLSDQYIPAGETIIATYSGAKPVMTSAIMADHDAQPVHVTFLGEMTSIGQIAETSADAVYYSPSGARLNKPVKGINIVKTVNADGISSSKVIYIK